MDMCPKCFEMNDADADFCTQCGAPLRESGEGSDAEVYTEFARANLLRIRGDTKGAVDVCLKILRRFPNNVTAHTLLGDVYLEAGQLKDANEWYEMALDLDPSAKVVQAKLAEVASRVAQREASEAAQQIGYEPKPLNPWPYVIAVGVMVAAVAFGAFLLGRQSPTDRTNAPIQTPIEIGAPSRPEPTVVEPPTTATTPTTREEPAVQTPPATGGIAQELNRLLTGGPVVLSATQDPRGPRLSLNVSAQEDIPPAESALAAALAAFGYRPDLNRVHVVVLEGSRTVYAATLYADAATAVKTAMESGQALGSQTNNFNEPWTPGTDGQTTAGSPENQ